MTTKTEEKGINLKNENKIQAPNAQIAGKSTSKSYHMKSVSHQTVSGSTSSASVMVLDKKQINFNTSTKIDHS
jgi:uncharacterized phage protein gp47/JayE